MPAKTTIRLITLLGFYLGCAVAGGTHCQAQLYSIQPKSIPSLKPIGDAAKRSVDQLDPDKIADVEDARDTFVESVDELKSHLSRMAGQDNAKAWMEYLEINSVLDAIEDEESSVALAKKATRVSQKATGTHPGLEVTAVRRVRRAADDYSNALRFSRKERMMTATSP